MSSLSSSLKKSSSSNSGLSASLHAASSSTLDVPVPVPSAQERKQIAFDFKPNSFQEIATLPRASLTKLRRAFDDDTIRTFRDEKSSMSYFVFASPADGKLSVLRSDIANTVDEYLAIYEELSTPSLPREDRSLLVDPSPNPNKKRPQSAVSFASVLKTSRQVASSKSTPRHNPNRFAALLNQQKSRESSSAGNEAPSHGQPSSTPKDSMQVDDDDDLFTDLADASSTPTTVNIGNTDLSGFITSAMSQLPYILREPLRRVVRTLTNSYTTEVKAARLRTSLNDAGCVLQPLAHRYPTLIVAGDSLAQAAARIASHLTSLDNKVKSFRTKAFEAVDSYDSVFDAACTISTHPLAKGKFAGKSTLDTATAHIDQRALFRALIIEYDTLLSLVRSRQLKDGFIFPELLPKEERRGLSPRRRSASRGRTPAPSTSKRMRSRSASSPRRPPSKERSTSPPPSKFSKYALGPPTKHNPAVRNTHQNHWYQVCPRPARHFLPSEARVFDVHTSSEDEAGPSSRPPRAKPSSSRSASKAVPRKRA
jgi:hypothetical protein